MSSLTVRKCILHGTCAIIWLSRASGDAAIADSLAQIMSEIDTGYAPQRASIQQQQAQLPALEQAQESGLNATKDSAFNDILSGARQRNLGFSGIPLGEQAKYVATTYLPAVANLKQSFNQQGTSLTDALNSLNQNENQYAQTLRQSELDRDQQQQQFEQQLAESKAQAAAAQASPTFGGASGGNAPTAPADPYAGVDTAGANQAVKQLLHTNNIGLIAKTINAISKSAGYGNTYDKYKLELLQSLVGNSPYAALLGKVAKLNSGRVQATF